MITKLIPTSEAVPGMVVAEDVYGLQDYLIIPAHSELTNHSITRLKFYAIEDVLIELPGDAATTKVETPKKIEDELADTYIEYVMKTPEFASFKKNFHDAVDRLKLRTEILNGKLKRPIQANLLTEDITTILSESRNATHIVHMLDCMRNSDDVTYNHSISCGVLCNVMGRWLKYSPSEIQTLTICGLLHDIGKLVVPSAILDKPTHLTDAEYEIIKAHPENGYQILLDQQLDPRVLNSALMHHERVDGSGYPRGLKGDQIDNFSQIVAIADVYIAMTNPRVYRRANCPFDALSVFEQEGYQMFSPKLLLTFLEGMANSYVNSTVRLSDDRIGEIILIDSLHITRPIVKIGSDFIDLKEHYNLYIADIL